MPIHEAKQRAVIEERYSPLHELILPSESSQIIVNAPVGLEQRKAMAAAFAVLPVKVLWRLSQSEVPDEPATAELKLGNNTKVACCALSFSGRIILALI